MKTMKKLSTLIMAITVASGAVAQSLYFNDAGGGSVDGTNIVVPGLPSNPNLSVYLELGNSSGADLNVKVTRYEMTCVTGAENYFCWAQCYGNVPGCDAGYAQFPDPGDVQWSDYLPISAGSSWPANGLYFGAYYIPNGNVGASTYRFVAFDASDPNDSTWVDITFDISVGVDDENDIARISDAYPNPAINSTAIKYEFATDGDAVLDIYNMIGDRVKQLSVAGTEGTIEIDTEELESGIYFYSLYFNGEAIKSKKLIVAH